jgi:hypothetical protein
VHEVLVELLSEVKWKLEHLESHNKEVKTKLIESPFFFKDKRKLLANAQ